MPVNDADRPIDTVREEAIDQLILNYGHGQLSLEAFERRLETALDARDHETLISVTADLELKSEPGFQDTKRRAMGMDDSDAPATVEHAIAICGGTERAGRWTVPSEIRVVAALGGVDLDFSRAEFSRRVVRVRLFGFMGGIDIMVPEGVNVEANTFCIFGGFSNKAAGQHDPEAPTIVIDGFLLMAGADVRVKRSRKERLIRLADDIKAFYGRLREGDSPRLRAVDDPRTGQRH
jgi:hypothetical protein